jgi:hypothetical protein
MRGSDTPRPSSRIIPVSAHYPCFIHHCSTQDRRRFCSPSFIPLHSIQDCRRASVPPSRVDPRPRIADDPLPPTSRVDSPPETPVGPLAHPSSAHPLADRPLAPINSDLSGANETPFTYFSFPQKQWEYAVLWPVKDDPSRAWTLNEVFVFLCDLDCRLTIHESGDRRVSDKDHTSQFFQFTFSRVTSPIDEQMQYPKGIRVDFLVGFTHCMVHVSRGWATHTDLEWDREDIRCMSPSDQREWSFSHQKMQFPSFLRRVVSG